MARAKIPKRFRNVKTQMRAFGREWLRLTKEFTDGPILNQRTGTLHGSLAVEDRTDEDPPQISVTAEAIDKKTGFPYATYHEFVSGKSYIRFSQLFIMSKWFSNKAGGSIIARAAAVDSLDLFMDGLVDRGWKLAPDLSGPGILTKTAFRTIRLNMSGEGFEVTGQRGVFF